MKRTRGAKEAKRGDSPSRLIDARIAALSDGRGETLARVRSLIKEAAARDGRIARMKAEGAIFVSYKTLFYELAAMVGNEKIVEMPGPLPKGLTP